MDRAEARRPAREREGVEKTVRGRPVGELEGDQPAEPRHLRAGELVLRVRREPWIVDDAHRVVRVEGACDGHGALVVPRHAHVEGADPA